MKRVLFVTPYFAPAWGYGGPPRINYDLARFLMNRGYSIEVATTDALDRNHRCPKLQEQLDGISVKRFRNISNWLAWRWKIFAPLGFGAYLEKQIRHIDFVYLSDFRDWQNLVAFRLCRRYQIPYAVAAYGSLPIVGGGKAPIKRFFDRFWGKAMIRNARYLFAQTNHEMTEYRRFGGRKDQIQLLPLGVNVKAVRPPTKKGVFRREYKIERNEKVLLFVGRINYLKGIDFLIEAFSIILSRHPRTRLVLIGRDDGYLSELQRSIEHHNLQGHALFVGPLYGKDSYPAYVDADLFVFTPRHYEETSLACLTSLAMGTPVITTREASIPFLAQYGAGYEIPRKKSIFADTVIRSLQNRTQRLQMGRQGKKLVRAIFDLPKVGARLERFIAEATHD